MSRNEPPRNVGTDPRLPRLLSVDDVAEQLSVSTKTVRRLIDRGALRACRIGRLLRIDRTDLEDLKRRGTVFQPQNRDV